MILAVVGMQVSAVLSMLACFALVVVILRLGLTKRLFIKLVFYIALCDFASAMAMVIGRTASESAACYYQGIVNNYFTLASIFWTMVIGYEVQLVVWYHRVQTDLRIFSVIIWIFPLILSLIPLSTSTYGNDDGTPGWCFLNQKPGYPHWLDIFWFIMSFYAWVYVAIFYLLYVAGMCAYKLFYLQRGMATDVHVIVERVIYYPVIVIVCWVVSSIIDIGVLLGYNLSVNPHDPIDVVFTYMLPNLQGFLSGAVFFLTNLHVLEEFWKEVSTDGWFVLGVASDGTYRDDGQRDTSATGYYSDMDSENGDSSSGRGSTGKNELKNVIGEGSARENSEDLASHASSFRRTNPSHSKKYGKYKTNDGYGTSSFASTADLNLLDHAYIRNDSSMSSSTGKDSSSRSAGMTPSTSGPKSSFFFRGGSYNLSSSMARPTVFGSIGKGSISSPNPGNPSMSAVINASTAPVEGKQTMKTNRTSTTINAIGAKVGKLSRQSESAASNSTKHSSKPSRSSHSQHDPSSIGGGRTKRASQISDDSLSASNYNAVIRNSDIEMQNSRVSHTGSTSYAMRNSKELGNWDENTEDGDSEGGYYEEFDDDGSSDGSRASSARNSLATGGMRDSTSSGGSRGNKVNMIRMSGSNKRQSLSKLPPVLDVITEEEDRDSHATGRMYSQDQGVGPTVSPMFCKV